MSYETREALNQPFEFDELLVDQDARRALLRAGRVDGVFASAEAPVAPRPLPTRKIAVRLRTINNACDAPFKTHDGQPVTEVSMYGSRDRQYLVAPYWAVRRLMAGNLPPEERWEMRERLSNVCELLEARLGHIEAFLSDPETKNTDALVAAACQERLSEHLTGRRREIPFDTDWHMNAARRQVRALAGIDLVPEHLSAIRAFSERLAETIGELRSLETTFTTSEWYWGWTVGMKNAKGQIEQLRAAYRTQLDMLRGSDWPDSHDEWS